MPNKFIKIKKYLFIVLLVEFWSCEKDKYDFIDEGKCFNKNTGKVEYKIQNRWVVEKEFIKHQKSDDAIIDEVKKILKNVILASRMLKQAKNELTFDIERLVNDGYLVQMKKVHWLLLLVKNHFPEVME